MKVGTEFSNVWGEYKNHSNPYIQGNTVPCDVTTASAVMLWISFVYYMSISDHTVLDVPYSLYILLATHSGYKTPTHVGGDLSAYTETVCGVW